MPADVGRIQTLKGSFSCAGNDCLGCPLPLCFMLLPLPTRMVCYMFMLFVPISILVGLNTVDLDSGDRDSSGNGVSPHRQPAA